MEKFKELKDIWYLILAVMSLTIWYANVNSRLSTVEAKQEEQKNIVEEINQLKIYNATIIQKQDFMAEDIKYIKQRI